MTAPVSGRALKDAWLHKALIRGAPFVFLVGFSHLAYQIWKHWDIITIDFRYFWLAGEMWTRGDNPYDAAYIEEARNRFDMQVGAIWVYAPNWFPIAAIQSLLSPLGGSRLWLIANGALLLGASWLNVRTLQFAKPARTDDRQLISDALMSAPTFTLFLLHAGAVSLMQAAGNTLHLGQSSILIYFGLSLLLYGMSGKRPWFGAIGLALVMLKPQIGIVLLPALGAFAYGRRVMVLAGSVSLLMAAPALIITPAPDILLSMAGRMLQYNDLFYNMPGAMTGLRHIVWALGGPDFGSGYYILLALSASCGLALAARGKLISGGPTALLYLTVVCFFFLAPLHVYDLVALGAVALPAAVMRAPFGTASLAAFAVLWRAGNLPQIGALEAAAPVYYPGSLYATLACAALFAAMLGAYGPKRAASKRPTLAAVKA
ncbi:MAG: glycosyltransferase 87 family protein [Pseudomonadota bacterium]